MSFILTQWGFKQFLLLLWLLIWLIRFINSRQMATPRKSQMTKVVRSDFLTVAEAMTSAFSATEKIKLGI